NPERREGTHSRRADRRDRRDGSDDPRLGLFSRPHPRCLAPGQLSGGVPMTHFPPKVNCFVCGALRGETNHWSLAILKLMAIRKQGGAADQVLLIADFNEETDGKPICGNNCVHKLVERWLQTGSLEPPRGSAADAAPRRPAGEPAC